MKKILSLLLVLVMVVSLVACGNKDNTRPSQPETSTVTEDLTQPETPTVAEDPQPTDEPIVVDGLKSETFVIDDNTATVDSTLVMSQKKPEETALAFLTAIATNQHAAMLELMNINDSTLVTTKDVEFNIPRSDFSTIVDYAGKTCYVLIRPEDVARDGDMAIVKAMLMDDSNQELTSFTFNLAMDANNNWVIIDEDFAVTNFNLVVPGYAKVFIDDVELESKYFVEKTGAENMYDLYNIDYIGKSIKKIKIVGTGFEKEIEHTPSSNIGDPLKIEVKLNGEELDKMLYELKLLWNNMYTDYINGVPESELLTKYFTAKADAGSAALVVNKFNAMTEEFKDPVMAEVLPHDNKNSYFLTENVMLLNFKYNLTFIDGNRESSRKQIGHVWFAIENDTYKIAKISDDNILNPQWINQW